MFSFAKTSHVFDVRVAAGQTCIMQTILFLCCLFFHWERQHARVRVKTDRRKSGMTWALAKLEIITVLLQMSLNEVRSCCCSASKPKGHSTWQKFHCQTKNSEVKFRVIMYYEMTIGNYRHLSIFLNYRNIRIDTASSVEHQFKSSCFST
jgi:hypothetical protein